MNRNPLLTVLAIFFLLGSWLGLPARIEAHCDTLAGPVVQTARIALDQGEITSVLKWVRPADEEELRAAFARTLAVRGKGADIRELADRYFFETLVRIHRAGEGAPYTGLKAATDIDPAVALADEALEKGNADQLVHVLTDAVASALRDRFQQALQAQKHADDNVAAGREFVASYVQFTHYVEGLHKMVQAGSPQHGTGGGRAEGGHGH